MKLLKHKWIKQDGFKTHKCEYCGCVRKWNSTYQKLLYNDLFKPKECKRIFHNDKISA